MSYEDVLVIIVVCDDTNDLNARSRKDGVENNDDDTSLQ